MSTKINVVQANGVFYPVVKDTPTMVGNSFFVYNENDAIEVDGVLCSRFMAVVNEFVDIQQEMRTLHHDHQVKLMREKTAREAAAHRARTVASELARAQRHKERKAIAQANKRVFDLLDKGTTLPMILETEISSHLTSDMIPDLMRRYVKHTMIKFQSMNTPYAIEKRMERALKASLATK